LDFILLEKYFLILKSKFMQQTLTPAQKQEIANQPKLEMSQEKLELIDSKLSVAPDGSKFINSEVQKTLTQTETVEINKALTNFNKLPEATKDGRDSAGDLMSEILIESEKQISLGFGEVKVNAQSCTATKFKFKTYWYGVDIINGRCGWLAAGILISFATVIISVTFSLLCGAAGWICWWGTRGISGVIIGAMVSVAGKSIECKGAAALKLYIWNFLKGGDTDCA
jgi:hypothetical protein